MLFSRVGDAISMPSHSMKATSARTADRAPGVIDTDMSNFTKTEAGRDVTLQMQTLKRIGKPEDVADVVAFSGGRCSALDHWCEHSCRRGIKAITDGDDCGHS
jgi:NAD(P)-dependent dehydrogenase (short-subunit alcohol dehydrogenase family)